ncbi:AraC family transcriptional regulator [Paenibacillus solisilvae]|uniref:AraC family transcriptional regulator n=1 Tax=Paenibacillus solisilvae TaxID=2486751 RepID=A0ABW0W641_9BACL
MNPIRKQFNSTSQFPFELVHKDRKHPQDELPDHFHDWYEIVYVYHGCGTFFIDHTFYEMNKGDLFLIPGNTIHRAFPDSYDPVTSSALFFVPLIMQPANLGEVYSSLGCFEHAKKLKSYKLVIAEQDRNMLEGLIEAIHQEEEQQQLGHRQAALLYLGQLLLCLNRGYTPDSVYKEDFNVGPIWMRQILQYIDSNPVNELSLAALSERASVSAAHFSRVFKQLTGMNVTDYVIAKRIVLAKELLLQSDDNISVIAEKSGFESLPHFHRMFKKATGITPAKYKKYSDRNSTEQMKFTEDKDKEANNKKPTA